MNELGNKSGKLLLEKCIENIDDIANLISFIEEKMASWSRLKVVLIGKEFCIYTWFVKSPNEIPYFRGNRRGLSG